MELRKCNLNKIIDSKHTKQLNEWCNYKNKHSKTCGM